MASPLLVDNSTATVPAAQGKYLTFALGREEYALQILKVREIIGYMRITPVPRTPPYLQGVINLRGRVISVIDLRTRFGMEPVEVTRQTCIIVVETSKDGRTLNTGLIVDRVLEVLEISGDHVEEPPPLGPSISMDFIAGLGKSNGSVKILLDIDRVLAIDESAPPPARQLSLHSMADQ